MQGSPQDFRVEWWLIDIHKLLMIFIQPTMLAAVEEITISTIRRTGAVTQTLSSSVLIHWSQ